MNDSWDNQRVESGEILSLYQTYGLTWPVCLFQFDYKLNVGTSHFTLDKGASATPSEPAAAASPGGRNYKNCHTPSWGQQLASSDGVKISSDDTRHLSSNISISDPVLSGKSIMSAPAGQTTHNIS